MKMLSIGLLCMSAVASLFPARNHPPDPKMIIGPNILASRDGNFPHVELMIAANPKNKKNLLGAAMTMTRADGGLACKTYATFDGGYSWHDSVFLEQVTFGGADPQVAFSPHGTAYFAALARVKDEHGRTRSALHFYRSEDGGRSWSRPADLGYSYDHPQIAVDHTVGHFAGRIYIGVLYGRDYSLGVFRSDDDGHTFVGPVKVLDGKGIGVNVSTLMVLSDGTLVMTYGDFQIDPAKRKTARESSAWLVTSKDGGVTFSTPTKIATSNTPADEDPSFRLGTFHAYAADSRSSRYRDRLYTAWTDFNSAKPRVVFSYSADAGKSWKEPKPVDATAPEAATQFQPAVAVNEQGIVGVMWFDTRGLKNDDSEYHAFFTASVDGGESFLPPARLSSAPSLRWGGGNLAYSPSAWAPSAGTQRITFLSAAQRFSNGGDYMGLTADAGGVFHPFWADGRTGTFQAWTSLVRVGLSAEPLASTNAVLTLTGPGAATVVQQERSEVSLTDKIQLVMDPTTYDPATRELQLPIRLKNLSDQPIYKPITVQVKVFGSGMGDLLKDKSPLILNATNGQPRDGATFDYSSALRDLEALEPQGQTEAMVWRFKLTDPLRTPDMHINVTGFVLRNR